MSETANDSADVETNRLREYAKDVRDLAEVESVDLIAGRYPPRLEVTIAGWEATPGFEDLRELSEDGYKRRFLAVRSASETTHTIDLDSHPVAHFDGDKWECREQDGDLILIKRDAEVTIDE